jgi:hypothetical protein
MTDTLAEYSAVIQDGYSKLQVVVLYWLKWLACSSWYHTSGISE